MATTVRATLTLGPGSHRIRLRVSSPYGNVRLEPVVVEYGAQVVEGAFTATATDALEVQAVPVGLGLAEGISAITDAANATRMNASLAERVRCYEILRPSGLTVGEILRSGGFIPWWHRWQRGGSAWARRYP